MLKIAVTGKQGQVARSLIEQGPFFGVEVISLGRPELDLAVPDLIHSAINAAKPDIVVNAAAYTAVDLAEKEPDQAMAINGRGAGTVAAAARELDIPVIHLSTDYVFDGTKQMPYVESDPVAPLNVYGATKLAGEKEVADATPNHVILRTAWVYSPFGRNFVRTMLQLAQTRSELRVVADQFGCPTYAPNIASAIVAIAQNLLDRPAELRLRGLFHLSGTGETNWAEFASAIFAISAGLGRPDPSVIPISTADYPTPARRPANSRLDCTKLACIHQVRFPHWRVSLEDCLTKLH
jgi:dTDP-4-dehydrorhamnose reductase